MRSYRQYCPIARASEILAERWTPLIIRNLMFGADTFSDLARGVPAMSRSMLIRRLGELEQAAIIDKTPKDDGRGHTYRLTDAGRDLTSVIEAMGTWGETWIEVTTEHSDPGFALWAWCQVQMNRDALPAKRTLVSFRFPSEPAGKRYYWLLIEDGDAEICYSDPGGAADAHVVAGSLPFVNWHRGRLSWSEAVRSGGIEVSGDRRVVRSLPTWNLGGRS